MQTLAYTILERFNELKKLSVDEKPFKYLDIKYINLCIEYKKHFINSLSERLFEHLIKCYGENQNKYDYNKIKSELTELKYFSDSFINYLMDEKLINNDSINNKLNVNFNIIKNEYLKNNPNPRSWKKWYIGLCEKDSRLIPYDSIYNEYRHCNFIEQLGIQYFYKDLDELIENIYKYSIDDFEEYIEMAIFNEKMPLDVLECYDVFPNQFIGIIKIRKEKAKK
jgi:hypothetical protein